MLLASVRHGLKPQAHAGRCRAHSSWIRTLVRRLSSFPSRVFLRVITSACGSVSLRPLASAKRCTVVGDDAFRQTNGTTDGTLLECRPDTVVGHRCGHPSRWVAWVRWVVRTSMPQAGQRTYVYPVCSPYASVSTNGPSQSVVGLEVDTASVVVVPVDSTLAGSLADMLPCLGARSGVFLHAPAISDRCPALPTRDVWPLPLSSWCQSKQLVL